MPATFIQYKTGTIVGNGAKTITLDAPSQVGSLLFLATERRASSTVALITELTGFTMIREESIESATLPNRFYSYPNAPSLTTISFNTSNVVQDIYYCIVEIAGLTNAHPELIGTRMNSYNLHEYIDYTNTRKNDCIINVECLIDRGYNAAFAPTKISTPYIAGTPRFVIIENDNDPGPKSFFSGTSVENEVVKWYMTLFRAEALVKEPEVLPTITVTSPTVNVSTGIATFKVHMSLPRLVSTTITYNTSDLTGVAGTDYIPVTGTITLLPGEQSKEITVTLLKRPVSRSTIDTSTFVGTLDSGILL